MFTFFDLKKGAIVIHTIRVINIAGRDPAGENLLREAKQRFAVQRITAIRTAKVYRVEDVSIGDALQLAHTLCCEHINQRAVIDDGAPIFEDAPSAVYEVAYRPGVMNPEAASLMKAACLLLDVIPVAADSSIAYAFYGAADEAEVRNILGLVCNPAVQHVVAHEPETLRIRATARGTDYLLIRDCDDAKLLQMNKERQLALAIDELHAMRRFFINAGRNPTDAEVEMIAQTWSEHCCHKTFNARLVIDGVERRPLFTRLKETSKKYAANALSMFDDNSGVIRLTDGLGIAIKLETHNSPSALEPYGGAATGSGGVFRDIIGTGRGAKCIASMDIFCVGPPDLPAADVPDGCHHPRYLLRRIVDGVGDYGNRMGIPTANGSVIVHPDFRAKPTVLVGAVGIIPADNATKGRPQPRDAIIAIGGHTGRDGIHGATFSSLGMSGETAVVSAGAVQIGNAIEEKRVADAVIALRDAGLIRAITDCGAGGFSSAIGEMASETGCLVHLDWAPLKYDGLAPWEIWVSESQERMVLAVAPQHVANVFSLCADLNVDVAMVGFFTESKSIVVKHGKEKIIDLPTAFLADGRPERMLAATTPICRETDPEVPKVADWRDTWCRVMAHPNVCSKEPIVRRYDHTVQGTNVLPPYGGVMGDAPMDALVLAPLLGRPEGIVLAHGLNPVLSRIDPYWSAVWSATEALSNFAAVGGDYRSAGLVDNFISAEPEGERLGALDRAMDALVDVMDAFEIPFVSGKDSLSSTYRGNNGTRIDVPLVVCVTAVGPIPDVAKTVSSDFKLPGSRIILLGGADHRQMAGSTLLDTYGLLGRSMPRVNLAEFRRALDALHGAIGARKIFACHDVSQGGIAVAITEMCFGRHLGAEIDVRMIGPGRPDFLLFNETPGRFIVELAPCADPDELFADVPHAQIGTVSMNEDEDECIMVLDDVQILCTIAIDDLRRAWQRTMEEVFA